MTRLEHPSTARRRRAFLPLGVALLSCTAVTLAAGAVLPATPASADSLTSAKAEAATLANQIQVQSQQLAALSEKYDQAVIRVGQLDQQLAQTRDQIAQTRARVAADRANLRGQALDDYTSGGSASGLEQLFSPGGERSSVISEYQKVASGNVSNAIDRLNGSEDVLNAQENQLQATETQAQAALSAAQTAKQAAQTALADQQATLSKVKGQIASLVAQQQAAAAAAQAAAFRQRVADQAAAAAAARGSLGGVGTNVPPPSAGGAAAVAAAMSQLGVPYVWAGATPGQGFDCSGLTMWAWGRAGVSLPHSAAAQYDDTVHVPLSDLQPGDLLFFDEGGIIGHVAMFIGGGRMIQAPETGQNVEVTSIWSNGLVGAGRP